jgi:hypothetical protein
MKIVAVFTVTGACREEYRHHRDTSPLTRHHDGSTAAHVQSADAVDD